MTNMDDFLACRPAATYGPDEFYALIIPDEIDKLKRVLEVIAQWDSISKLKLYQVVIQQEIF
jgi:hypothetical protein